MQSDLPPVWPVPINGEVPMSMTITPSSCPECGAQIKGTCDVIPGTARVFQNEDGTFEFSGETDVHWGGLCAAGSCSARPGRGGAVQCQGQPRRRILRQNREGAG